MCPLTKTSLDYDAERQELISRAAGLAYPIRDGIPIMLPEEARKLDADARRSQPLAFQEARDGAAHPCRLAHQTRFSHGARSTMPSPRSRSARSGALSLENRRFSPSITAAEKALSNLRQRS